jgi:esterase/lipase superfamily enzyme
LLIAWVINALSNHYDSLQEFHRFQEIILSAPDIDAEVFLRLAAHIKTAGQRVTLYASKHDRALQMSKYFNGYPRAGDATDEVIVVPGIDSIDASAVDTSLMGHSYYGGSRSVLDDIFYLIRGLRVSERAGIRASNDGRYWVFQP